MMHSTPELILFEVIILLSAISSIKKRRETIIHALEQIEEECVAVVSKRMKSVKIYLDQPPKKIVGAFICSKRLVTDNVGNLRTNKKSIILKQRDGSMYMGDPYLHQTMERYLELRASRNLCRLARLEYNDLKDDIIQSDGTLDKVYGICKTEYQGSRRVSCRKRKNQICKICPKKHLGHEEYRCQRNDDTQRIIIPVIDAKYSKPDISGHPVDYLNVADGRGGSSTTFKPLSSIRYPSFTEFLTRLSTFKSWRSHPSPRSLAENGFFYQGVGDTTICYSCAVALKHWDPDDDALLEHIRYSPTCNHLENSLGRKTIEEYLDQIGTDPKLKNGFNGGCVAMDGGVPTVTTNLTEDHHEENKRSRKSARSPGFQSTEVRLSTFAKFPNSNAISIRDIVQAGFYYTGMNDLVRCYWCDLGLKEWEYGEDPYKEHARYLPDCDHLRYVKGEDFIMHIQKETHQLPKRRSPTASPRESVGAGKREIPRKNCHEDSQKWNSIIQDQNLDKEKASTNLLCTPAAQSVLEHGYTDELVLAAIRKLDIADDTKLTAIQILEVIFDAEEKGTDLTQKNTGYDSQKYQDKNVQNHNEECQQLLADNQRLKSLMLCKYCQARERNMLLLPCAHRSLCHECANKTNMCPECWKPIKEKVRTYMA